jgi:hypothetical protein
MANVDLDMLEATVQTAVREAVAAAFAILRQPRPRNPRPRGGGALGATKSWSGCAITPDAGRSKWRMACLDLKQFNRTSMATCCIWRWAA